MEITAQQLVAATGCGPARAVDVAAELTRVIDRYAINSPVRMAHFLAQCAHESMLFMALEENLNYSKEGLATIWPSRFYLAPAIPHGRLDASAFERAPQAIANAVYAARLGNGAPESGDGWRYRGRGFIQITGRSNYAAFAIAAAVDVLANPDWLTSTAGAASSAAWFWKAHGCNEAADTDSIVEVTRRVNGGTVGMQDRIALTQRARAAFGIQGVDQ